MKTVSFIAVAMTATFSCLGQTEQEEITTQEDPLFTLADSATTAWDFSAFNFTDYPNTQDSDLVQRFDPATVYNAPNGWPVGIIHSGELTPYQYEEEGLTLSLVGTYSGINEGNGTLTLAGETITGVDKIRWTETYVMLFAGDSVATYTNTYFSFFKAATKQKLFETFKKHRALGAGSTNYIMNGISDCIVCSATGAAADIGMVISPNPTSGLTTVSYTLWSTSDVVITITDQSGAVNTTLFQGQNAEGANSFEFSAQGYVTGLYTIYVTVDGVAFSLPLIIQ